MKLRKKQINAAKDPITSDEKSTRQKNKKAPSQPGLCFFNDNNGYIIINRYTGDIKSILEIIDIIERQRKEVPFQDIYHMQLNSMTIVHNLYTLLFTIKELEREFPELMGKFLLEPHEGDIKGNDDILKDITERNFWLLTKGINKIKRTILNILDLRSYRGSAKIIDGKLTIELKKPLFKDDK